MDQKDLFLSAFLGIGFFVLCLILVHARAPVDIVSPYLAGWFFENGQWANIYGFPASKQFSALPPQVWSEAAHARGFLGTYLTPYLYAPLWAALLAPVAAHYTISEFVLAVYIIQVPLIFASVYICWSCAGRRGWFVVWATFSLLVYLTNAGGLISLVENQPQLTLTFLVLFGFWLFQSSHFRLAGMVFALAASLKLYPLVFGLIFVAKKQWVGAAYMIGTGGALLASSLYLAGISLHLDFLAQLQDIAAHAFVSRHNWSLSSLFFQLQSGFGGPGDRAMYLIVDTPNWIRVVIASVFVAGCIGFVVLFSRIEGKLQQFGIFLAFVLLVGLTSPLGWSHNFLPLVYSAPIFLLILPLRRASALIVAVFGVQTLGMQVILDELNTELNWAQIVGTLSVTGALFVLVWGVWGKCAKSNRVTSGED